MFMVTVISVGPLTLHLYGLILGFSVLVGAWVSSRLAPRFGVVVQEVWDGLIWVGVAGVVGARGYHVIDLWEFYRENVLLIPQVWRGGLGIYGAVVGGVVGLGAYCWWMCSKEFRAAASTRRAGSVLGLASQHLLVRIWFQLIDVFGLTFLPGGKPGQRERRKWASSSFLLAICVKQRFLRLADVAAFGVPVGQAVGRWGNFVNQELYGLPTDLPWGIPISLERRVAGFEQYPYFHPLFLYESLWSLVTAFFLLGLYRLLGFKRGRGTYFVLYLFFYSLGRFFLEGLRIEPWRVFGVATAQIIAGIIMVVVLTYLLIKRNNLYEKR